jgi:AraC family transcriptional regulator of adaptative response/methylated-DNA-[protein]-cysteine methyltransferase
MIEQARIVHGCRSTKIYCRENCPPGRRTKPENRVTFASATEAQRAGYRACKVCLPDVFSGAWPAAQTTRALQSVR